jgi:hypothetical protein
MEETVYVVFKYLTKAILWKGLEPRRISTTLIPSCVDILLKDDVTVILLLDVSLLVLFYSVHLAPLILSGFKPIMLNTGRFFHLPTFPRN